MMVFSPAALLTMLCPEAGDYFPGPERFQLDSLLSVGRSVGRGNGTVQFELELGTRTYR